ncbi:hypothetical protein FJV76_30405 [Mesorhizobium sp. WSM4303]|nr:hypothetical protein FJV77_29705 [Mesorhizobium sp. WSM4306]TRC94615.1 hypothetical protein FJV76_30405 [Mesorhizobium sp. WSM4303]
MRVPTLLPGAAPALARDTFASLAGRYFWGLLLQAGVRIFEFQPTMYHPKLLSWTMSGRALVQPQARHLPGSDMRLHAGCASRLKSHAHSLYSLLPAPNQPNRC